MANSASRLRLEAAIRTRLAEVVGAPLVPRRLPTSWLRGGSGTPMTGDFDAVSEDGSMVAQISTSVWLQGGQRKKIVTDAARMAAVPGVSRRLLAFATKMAADDARGMALPAGTEIVLVPLDAEEMRLLVEETEAARKEMGTGVAVAPGGGAGGGGDRRQRRFDESLAWMRGGGEDRT